MSNDSQNRSKVIESQVMGKYEKMLHPPSRILVMLSSIVRPMASSTVSYTRI